MSQQNNRDATEQFLENLPELEPGKSFQFACHPGVKCFNACCGDLNLMLTPYDVLRLRKGLEMDSRSFVTTYTDVAQMPGSGFPMVRLRMTDGNKRPCPFVRKEGCSIYPDRPAACRTYPLGRATKPDGNGGITEQFFVVSEDHCKGFKESSKWTSEEWLKDQGLEPYNESNDAYMGLISRCREAGVSLNQQQVNMAFLALFQLDQFRKFMQDMKVTDRLELSAEEIEKLYADDEATLAFALNWLELVLLGKSDNLKAK